MNSFDEFELEARLERELKRVEPPEGFAGRVMERVTTAPRVHLHPHGGLLRMPRRVAGRVASIAVAAMLLAAAVLGGWQWRQRQLDQQRQQAAQVQRQFDLAMQVTERTLEQVRTQIGRAGVKEASKQ